jgi:hypothetical protein
MLPRTINLNTVTVAPTASLTADVQGTVVYAGGISNLATFTQKSNLEGDTSYTLTVTTGAEDLAGNALAKPFSCPFTTGPEVVDTPPTVIRTNPTDGQTGVALDATVNATFNKAMDPLTITTLNVLLAQKVSGASVEALSVTYDPVNFIETFTPSPNTPLLADTWYTCTILGGPTGVKDAAADTPMTDTYSFDFETAATLGPSPVPLGSAALFVAVAGSTITSTGATVLKGNVALTPGSAVSGFAQESGPGVISGTLYIDDSIAAQAAADVLNAYNFAAGQSLNVISQAGELGGLSLAPGLYKSAPGAFIMTSKDLTLDAQGDANAVWIFQMASTLTTGTGTHVILANGANAANIFWQVGSSATLGVSSIMQGTILASASITLDTGAVLNGRALTQSGADTFDTNTVTLPTTAP